MQGIEISWGRRGVLTVFRFGRRRRHHTMELKNGTCYICRCSTEFFDCLILKLLGWRFRQGPTA